VFTRLALGSFACAHLALAQCSMCRTTAAAQGANTAVLNTAILVLFVPALTLFSAIAVATLKRSHREKRSSRE
jgi:hypothetical protein